MSRVTIVSQSATELPATRTGWSTIVDPARIRQFLRQSCDEGAQVTIWTRGGPGLLRARFDETLAKSATRGPAFAVRSETATGRFSIRTLEHWKKWFNAEPAGEAFFLAYLKRGGIMAFSAPPVFAPQKEGESITWQAPLFHFPTKIFRTSRRTDERYEIPGGYDVRMEIPGRPHGGFNRRVHDLSAGGLSFIVGESEAHEFMKNKFLPRVKFSIWGREIQFSATVQSRTPWQGRYKVGLSFRKISNENRNFIESYVLEHLIQYMGGLE